jgi:hypothetical protein
MRMRVYIAFYGDGVLKVTSDPVYAQEEINKATSYYLDANPLLVEEGEIGVAEVDGEYLGLLHEREESQSRRGRWTGDLRRKF